MAHTAVSDTERQQGDVAYLGVSSAHLLTSTKTRVQQDQGAKQMPITRLRGDPISSASWHTSLSPGRKKKSNAGGHPTFKNGKSALKWSQNYFLAQKGNAYEFTLESRVGIR